MTPWIIGNWKLNPSTLQQATTLAEHIAKLAKTLQNCQVMLAPSSLHMSAVQNTISKEAADVTLVSQDVCAYTSDTGAYTGDNSAAQLRDLGVEWVIIGHSERRHYYKEGHKLLLNKVSNSLKNGLGVIFCIGESEAQYIAGETQVTLNEQLAVISDLYDDKNEIVTKNLATKLIIAYEPVWAIGTGKVPSVDEVAQVHKDIGSYLNNISMSNQAEDLSDVPIIYGGSVNPNNAGEFASSPLISGVLVGGASLQADSFIGIAAAFEDK